jgi:hypothetical protein
MVRDAWRRRPSPTCCGIPLGRTRWERTGRHALTPDSRRQWIRTALSRPSLQPQDERAPRGQSGGAQVSNEMAHTALPSRIPAVTDLASSNSTAPPIVRVNAGNQVETPHKVPTFAASQVRQLENASRVPPANIVVGPFVGAPTGSFGLVVPVVAVHPRPAVLSGAGDTSCKLFAIAGHCRCAAGARICSISHS